VKARRALVALVIALGSGLVEPAAADPLLAPAGRFRRLNTPDGLSEARVRGILQDHEGFLWIGTANGLDRYDAFGVRSFRHDPQDPTSIAPGFPQALVEDREGRIWVGLLAGGLSRFDPALERFQSYRPDPADPLSLASDDVTTLQLDTDGMLWVGTRAGLDRLDPATGRFVHFRPSERGGLPHGDVTALLVDHTGALWAGTGGGGLSRLAKPNAQPAVFEQWSRDPRDPTSLCGDQVRALREDHAGRLWVGTWDGGLCRYDAERRRFVGYPLLPEPAPTIRVMALVEDHRGAIWVATWGAGLHHLDPETGRVTSYRPDAEDPQSLPHPSAVSLLEDRGRLLWIGTGGGGVAMLDLEPKGFRRIALESATRHGGSADVRTIVEDASGSLWVGTAGGGLSRVDRSGKMLEHYRHVPGDPGSLADDNVWSLLEDRSGTLWVGSFGGLDRFDRARKRFLHHKHDARVASSLSDDTVYALSEDDAGRLWIGTWRGLDSLDPGAGQFVHHPLDPDPASSGPRFVFSIATEGSKRLWLVQGRRILRYEPESGESAAVDVDAAVQASAPLARLIRGGPGGELWTGSSRGLVTLPAPGESERHAPRLVPIDFAGAAPFSLEWAESGAMWIGTTSGLYHYEPGSGATRRYDEADGLPSVSFGPGASLRTRDGELVFGTTQGLVAFRPEAIHDDLIPPPVVLTALALGTRSVGDADFALARKLASGARELRLPPDERVVTLQFAALSFRAPSRNRFRYRLFGFDPTWNELPKGRREVTYTNLAPGRYTFRVQGSNGDGVWNETGASLRLHALPPWWSTWWFRSLALAVATGLALAAHRQRIHGIREQNKRLEREVHERRLAQEALSENERLLRLIADALPVLIAYVDAGRRCVFSNLASEVWFRRPRTELQGRSIDDFLPAAVRETVAAPVERALAGAAESFELLAPFPGGETRHIAATLVPHADGDGSVRGFYALAQDITARVRGEDAVRRQQEELAHAARVLTLGEMAAALAHELNQPLAAILSNAQATLRSAPVSEREIEEVLKDIAQDAARGGQIIGRVRELARRSESRMERLDLNATIRRVELLLRPVTLEVGAELTFDLDPGLPAVRGDVVQVQQVVLNLARNGLEAVREAPRGRRSIGIRTSRDGEWAVTEVTDTGPAVDDGLLARLFEPFHTTKAAGLGMGLSISRSIVESHGGSISAGRSSVGSVAVRFKLPLFAERAARQA